jgi:hypothetical protein
MSQRLSDEADELYSEQHIEERLNIARPERLVARGGAKSPRGSLYLWTARRACPKCGGSGRLNHSKKIFGFIVIATYSWPCDRCLEHTELGAGSRATA